MLEFLISKATLVYTLNIEKLMLPLKKIISKDEVLYTEFLFNKHEPLIFKSIWSVTRPLASFKEITLLAMSQLYNQIRVYTKITEKRDRNRKKK